MPKRKRKKRKKKIIRAKRRRGFGSGLEEQFSFFLTELNIEFDKQKRVERKLYDFYLPKYNTLIEVDGDWFH